MKSSIDKRAYALKAFGLFCLLVVGIVIAKLKFSTKTLWNVKDAEAELASLEHPLEGVVVPHIKSIEKDNLGGSQLLRIVTRDAWLAQPPSSLSTPLHLPVSHVVVISTQTEGCVNQAVCTYRVRYIQTHNIESNLHDDIIYNFLIGADGNVYEGRGWDNEGAVLMGYNDLIISFAFIGTFRTQAPSPKQLNVTKLLLADGVRKGKLTANYKIIGANSIEPTSTFTSADALYASFKGWPHWSGLIRL